MQSVQCRTCIHYRGGRDCAAFPFPKKIPEEIFTGAVSHEQPYPGDNGIQYEEVDWDALEEEEDE